MCGHRYLTTEKLLASQLEQFQEFIFHKYITAFRKSYSCQSVRLSLPEDWHKALDHGKVVGTVLMELSKAFDSMPHSLLICKLHAYEISQNSLQLLTSYLTQRKQKFKLGNTATDWLDVEKGVPVLGPALFNIFINDIYSFFKKAKLSNYADDNSLSQQ